jgi:hypothetical protein
MRKFVVCNSRKKHSNQSADLVKSDDHTIIYCKNLKTVFEAWAELRPNVTRVTINNFTEDPVFTINPFYMNLQVNTNIKEIFFNCYTHDFWLKFILDTSPSVEQLYFFKLTKEKLKYAAENLEQLTNIYCDYIEEDAEDYYKKMKKTEKDINTSIKIN